MSDRRTVAPKNEPMRRIEHGGFYYQDRNGWGELECGTEYPDSRARKVCQWLKNIGYANPKVVTLEGVDAPPPAPIATARGKKRAASAPPVVDVAPSSDMSSVQLTLPGGEPESEAGHG